MTPPSKADRDRSTFALLVGLALLLCAGALGWLAHESLGYVNTDQPYGSLPEEERPVTPVRGAKMEHPGRVVLAVVGGLREDYFREVPWFGELEKSGFRAVLESAHPSHGRAAHAVIFTGGTADRTGIRTDRYLKPLPLDTIFDRATAAGITVAAGADLDHMQQNLGASIPTWHLEYHRDMPERVDEDMQKALEEKAGLTLLHFSVLDGIASREGTGESYTQAAHDLGERMKTLLEPRLDLSRDTLLVVTDHGNLSDGGHGGDEPEVSRAALLMAGWGIQKRGADGPEGSIGRVAPTLSALLGVEYPRDLSHPPLWEALEAPGLDKKARHAEWQDHRRAYERRWLDAIESAWTGTRWTGEAAGNHVSNAASIPENASLEELMTARRETLKQIRRDRRVGRTPLVALLLVPLGVMLVAGALRGYHLRPAAALPGFGVGFALMFFILGAPLSPSSISTLGHLIARFSMATVMGLLVYAAIAYPLLKAVPGLHRRGAARFHFTAMALSYAAVAPLCWLVMGFALKAPIPGPFFFFLPIAGSCVGGALLIFAGVSWVYTSFRPDPPLPPFQPPTLQDV